MRLALERCVSANYEPVLGLSIEVAKTTYMVSYRHCTFSDSFMGASLCHLHIFSEEKPVTALPQHYSLLSAQLCLHTQPSPLLYVISAPHFLTGNALSCNVRRRQASKEAQTLRILQSNPFDWSSIMFFTHPAGLSVPLEWNNIQLYTALQSITCFAECRRDKKGQQHIMLEMSSVCQLETSQISANL